MRRLLFLSADVAHARQVVDDLKRNGILEEHIYVLARYGTDLEDLPDEGPQGDDFLPAYKRGLGLGGTAGVLAGLAALAFPPAGIVVGGGLVVLAGLWGAGIGAMLTGIAGGAFPNSRLASFEAAIEAGKILVSADVPNDEEEKYLQMIRRLDPDIEVSGIEPLAALIP